jgi:hypothetical protein
MTSSSGRANEQPPVARTRLRWRGPDVLLRHLQAAVLQAGRAPSPAVAATASPSLLRRMRISRRAPSVRRRISEACSVSMGNQTRMFSSRFPLENKTWNTIEIRKRWTKNLENTQNFFLTQNGSLPTNLYHLILKWQNFQSFFFRPSLFSVYLLLPSEQ